jgi:hypothetical protein
VGKPVHVRTVSYPEGLFTTWDPVENSRGYEIRARVKGATGWWSEALSTRPPTAAGNNG